MIAALGIAAQLAIVAHAPDTVYACDAVEVTVAVSAGGTSIPSLKAPSFAPFDVLRGSTTPRVDFDSRTRRAVLAEYRFTVTTDRVGTFVVPPFEARLGAETVRSNPLHLSVLPMRLRALPTVVARARIDTSGEVNLRGATVTDTVFVGQQATYEVAVFLNQAVRDRLRRQPTFYPPEMQAMLAYDLPPVSPAQRRSGSQCFDALVYRRALFPLVAGRLVIPPAQLVYSTGLSSSSMFSREESHELQTDSVAIVAIDPPATGRPSEFVGAVGDMRIEARVDSASSRVGDPMLLTMRVSGIGNVKLFPRPALRVPWAAVVPADERVRVDSGTSRIGGEKEFDWVLTPRVAGEFDVPVVHYGYFDPARRRYAVATADARRLRIGPGSLASGDTSQAFATPSIRMRFSGPAWPSPQSRPEFWLAMALAPLPALIGRVRRRRERRTVVAATNPMRSLITTAASDPVILRRQFVRALGQRLGCNPEDFTRDGALERALRRAGVSEKTASSCEHLLRELDAAAYAGDRAIPAGAGKDAAALARAVDGEALARSELPFWIPALFLVVSLGLAGTAIAADTAETYFARGVSAYVRQDFAAAKRAFAGAASLAPRSADAWANYGTASWTAADTSAAVLGWRQALAIQPGAEDLQQRLELVRHQGPLSPGWVPPLPRGAGVWLFAILWVAAWTVAWLARRPHPWAKRLVVPMTVSAVLVGLIAIEMEERVSGKRLAVVRRASALTSDPAIGMDRGPALATGEIVRIAGRRGAWTRVEATDERDGWLPSSQLLMLADRRPPTE